MTHSTLRVSPVLLGIFLIAGCGDPASTAPDASPPPADAAAAPVDGFLPDGPDGEAFLAGEILGRPTDRSIAVSFVPAVDLETYVEYGAAATPGAFDKQTPPAPNPRGEPVTVVLDRLAADTAYEYRLRFRRPGEPSFAAGPRRTFHTARAPGAAFRFTVQADSHLDENSDLAQYHRTLANVAADAPDFHIDLGDTFMCEKKSEPLSPLNVPAPDQKTVDARYLYERGSFGLVAHSAPLFLVNGNHEGELGYAFTGMGMDIATWATLARHRYYLNPTPDAFYGGDAMPEPLVGQRAAYYSFQWGDALFIVLDPFWYTTKKTNMDGWVWTLGARQYEWLAQTLGASRARWKLVFLHNLVGGLDGQMRGGVEAAPYYEWGGRNQDGTPGFAAKRPQFAKPIHQLLVDAKVTAVFHGHDHLYARQELDGIVYQEVPQPSAKNTNNAAMLATTYHYAAGTILASAGHLRVTVAPDKVTGEYVRAWLPAAENAQKRNGQVADSWTVVAK